MRTIISVDSDAQVLQAIKNILETAFACRVKVFTRPSEALASISSERPALLTTSIMLPEFNGYELIRRIRTDSSNRFPILVISSSSTRPKSGLPEGVIEFMLKPFDLNELMANVRRLVPV